MSAVLSRPSVKPPTPDRLLMHLAAFALCLSVFGVLIRGCGSTVQAPERRLELVPNTFISSQVARSQTHAK